MSRSSVLFLAVYAWINPLAAADDYTDRVLPVLKESCLNCHSTKKQKGDLDLERFATVADIRRAPKVWESVLEQVASGEMPPKKEKPLAAASKQALLGWTRATLDEIALASAGDPGPVVLRRLANSEYTYAVRDLTGVATLDPDAAPAKPTRGGAKRGWRCVAPLPRCPASTHAALPRPHPC